VLVKQIILYIGFFLVAIASHLVAQNTQNLNKEKYQPSTKPKIILKDRYGDRISNPKSHSPLILKEPSIITPKIELDEDGKGFLIEEKIGNIHYRPPSYITREQYEKIRKQKDLKQFWKENSQKQDEQNPAENNSRRIIPPIYVSPKFDRIFGGNYIDIRPNGNINLDFGGIWQRIDNPSIPVRQQRSGGFNFNQQIALNIQGKIGEKLKVSINQDTKATFEFDNTIKLSYSGLDHDIIKSIEAGNVNLPLSSQLISGSQSLFGIRTQMQFGKLKVTTVLANKRGKTETVSLNAGSSPGRPVEIKCTDYEDNRHYFLAQFFREQYENSLKNLPQVTSGIYINRIEVYVTNLNANPDRTRSIVALTDLGEYKPYNTNLKGNPQSETIFGRLPDNEISNNLYTDYVRGNPNVRDKGVAQSYLESQQFVNEVDFEVINSAKILIRDREYKVNPYLGYISLNTPLQQNEVLAVAYEYTYNGQKYQVGELTGNLPDSNQLVCLKLLRSKSINSRLKLPMWDLMMKNVYNLGVSNISRKNFNLRVIYKDDATGLDNPSLLVGRNVANIPLVEILGADRLNLNNEAVKDGIFDFVNGITIDSSMGRIFFPVLEPFGSHIRQFFDADEQNLINNLVFQEIYDTTKAQLIGFPNKAKYFLSGTFQSGSTSEIPLNGFNIAQGSVRVYSGSQQLTENVDYTVNYDLGRVRIINEGVLNSGNKISVIYEKADLFNFRAKSLTGIRFDYTLNKDVIVGGTLMHLNERPLITRVAAGDEPIKNTMLGIDLQYKSESRFLTKAIDKLPLISTKEKSIVQFSGEYARLIPGQPKVLGKGGNAFIDDFEGARIPFDLTRSPTQWKLGSPPIQFRNNAGQEDYRYGTNRALLAWYNIDNIFYRQTGSRGTPPGISDDANKYHYTRVINPQEIFPFRSLRPATINEVTFDLAYFPQERGPYNYRTENLDSEGRLLDPKKNFAAITRAIRSNTDFDNINIQYIEFWLMDPFLEGGNGKLGGIRYKDPFTGKDTIVNNTTGGKLYFNLGNVSEDVLNDGRQSFENGLPVNGDESLIERRLTGKIPRTPYLNDAFQNQPPGARKLQDIGYDGLNSEEEKSYFQEFINRINSSNLSNEAKKRILADPSSDDFEYYLGENQNGKSIIDRYKKYNGLENNSPEQASSGTIFFAGSTTLPDNEDLNRNNTIDLSESYFEYEISIKPEDMVVGTNYIISQVDYNSNGETVRWYQFRIPIRDEKAKNVGGADLKTVQFIRMYLTDFDQPIVLRLAQFQMVATQWREEPREFYEGGLRIVSEPERTNFSISTVNVEENAQPSDISSGYVIPPGFVRDIDNTQQLNVFLNEQSLRLCAENLPAGTGRGAFKEVNINALNYERIKMFIHAEGLKNRIPDKKVMAFVRLGTDMDQNYYEVRIPLVMSDPRNTSPFEVWRAENELDISFDELTALKAGRKMENPSERNPMSTFTSVNAKGHLLSVIGNPDLTAIRVIVIGLLNPDLTTTDKESFCIWANELRLTGFNNKPGWASVGTANITLADFANVRLSGGYKGIGFGQIEQKVSQRLQEETTNYGIQSSINMNKIIPEKTGIKIPLFVSYDVVRVKPLFDPTNPDVKLESSAKFRENPTAYKEIMIDKTINRSINIMNMQKIKTKNDAQKRIYDIENITLSLSYSDKKRSNFQIAQDLNKTYRAGFNYTYPFQAKSIEPFKNSKNKLINKKYFKAVKEFNFSPLPNNIAFRADMLRTFTTQQMRNALLTTDGVVPTFFKSWTLDRYYNLRWNLTRNLNFDYNADVKALIDEPEGFITSEKINPNDPNSITKKDSVIKNLKKFGRIRDFNQQMNLNYRLPLDKFPITDWINADYKYSVNYSWRAGALKLQDTLGNSVQNGREQGINGRIDLNRLYNKSKFLKNINNPPPRNKEKPTKTIIKKKKDGTYDTLKIQIPEYAFLKKILKKVMMIKSFNISYTLQEQTFIPGYMPKVKFLGIDGDRYNDAPGIPFLLGVQNREEIQNRIKQGDWITRDQRLTDLFKQSRGEKWDIRSQVEPFKDFRIQVNFTKQKNAQYQELFKVSLNQPNSYSNLSPTRTGTYSISFLTISSAFSTNDKINNEDKGFKQFKENIEIVHNRLMNENPLSAANVAQGGNYSKSSPEVLIPSFIAAYSGQNPEKINLNAFPRIPMPNWRVDYSGLTQVPSIKKVFPSLNLSHAYTSTFNVNNYQSNSAYQDPEILSLKFKEESINFASYYLTQTSISDSNSRTFIPIYVLSDVNIRESFAPLLGINARHKKNITFGFQYKKDRTLALNTTNAQITETKGVDYAFNLGYVKSGLKLPIKNKGRTIILKNETNFRLDFTIRNQNTLQRRLTGGSVYTNGQLVIQVRPNITYVVNQRLNIQLYYERVDSRPFVSNSFRRVNTQFGIQARFILN